MFQTVEVVFTAYAVPALIVPAVWLTLRVIKREEGSWAGRLAWMEGLYGGIAAFWLLAGAGVLLGLPVERGGQLPRILAWAAYSALNIVFAWLLVRFTSGYGLVADEDQRDRLFSRLLLIVIAHPVATACAFAWLYRMMNLPYRLSVPGLGPVQEGI